LAGPDGAFGNRFDDPEGVYRVLYASSQRLGCFLETLARFRVDLKLYAELNEIAGDNDYVPLGQVPPEWAQRRAIGSAAHNGQYADIYGSEWIGRLRQALARDCVRLGIADIDASVLEGSAPRSLTQHASRIIYNAGFDGICYHSRYGHEIRNWGLFEPFKLEPQRTSDLSTDYPDFRKALHIHGLQIGP
jgi:RES domain